MSRPSYFDKAMNKKYKYNQLCRDCRSRVHTDVMKKKCPYCGSRRMSRGKIKSEVGKRYPTGP